MSTTTEIAVADRLAVNSSQVYRVSGREVGKSEVLGSLVTRWNDDPDRDAIEVAGALRSAAALSGRGTGADLIEVAEVAEGGDQR
ncbi:DUF6197 family protein [Pseudonocardia acaciae]|uniref:DUF6197 family protein n=1 Tax=Pseudonocardia acaciae TaxID=551276 RepID=UPI000490D19D|nr:hypothetical protein [Pseudonocardia acaciae]